MVGVHLIVRGAALLTGISVHGFVLSIFSTGLLAICLGLVLLLGFLTPITGIMSASYYFALVVQILTREETMLKSDISAGTSLVVISTALVLLGPGAYSLDARIFGRREIIIPEMRHPPL